MTLAELFVKLTADTKGFKQPIQEAGKDLQNLGTTAASVGSTLGKALPFAALIGTASAAAIKFEAVNVDIARTTGETGAKLEALNKSFDAVYTRTSASAEEVSRALSLMHARTETTGKALEELTLKSIKLAKVQHEDLGAVVPAITRVFGDWSIATDKQGSAMDFMRVVSQRTGTQVSKLAEQVVYAGAPLRQLGYSFEQATALIGKFEKEGVNTELVLGGMKAALSKFAKEGVEDTAGAWRDFVAGVRDGSITLQAVMKEVGIKRGVDLFKAIQEGRFEIDQTVESFKKLASEGGASVETLKSKVTKYAHELETLANKHRDLIVAGAMVAPVVQNLGKGMIGLAPSVGAAAAKVELFVAGLGAASTSYTTMLGTGILRVAGWFGLAVAIAQVAKATWDLITAQDAAKKSDKEASDRLLLLEISLRQQGADISKLTEEYNHGTMSYEVYLRKLQEVSLELGKTKAVHEQTAKVVQITGEQIEAAMKALGLHDLGEKAKETADAFALLGRAGVLTGYQVKAAAEAVQKAQDELSKTAYDWHAERLGVDTMASLERTVGRLQKSYSAMVAEVLNGKRSWLDAIAASEKLDDANKKLADRYPDTIKLWREATDALRDQNVVVLGAERDLERIHEALPEILNPKAAPTVVSMFEMLRGAVDEAAKPLLRLVDAFHFFGLQTREEIEETARAARAKFKLMEQAGVATANELSIAAVRLQQIETEAAYKAGKITVDEYRLRITSIEAMLDQLDGKHKQSTERRKGYEWDASQEMERSARRAFEGMERDIVRNLFEWDNWGKTVRNIGKNVAEDFLTIMLKGLFLPLEQQFAKLAGNIGTWLGGVSGIGSGAKGATSGAGGSVSSVAGGATGALNAVGAIASIGTLISSVIGNFQSARLEGTMNAVEHNTRYTMMYAGERGDGGILGVLFRIHEQVSWGPGVKAIESLRDTFAGWCGPALDALRGGGKSGGGALVSFTNCTFQGTSQNQVDALFNSAIAQARLAGAIG